MKTKFKFESMEEDYFNGSKESEIRPMMSVIKNTKTGETKSVNSAEWLGKYQFKDEWILVK